MIYIFALITAMAISMAVIPLMARVAPRIGMIDRPNTRKVHAKPIPRAGGVGIVLGALAPVVFWLPGNELLASYLFGAIVLLIFGVWDDIHELGHYTKFIGQLIAVVPIVFIGDIYVTHLPFFDAYTMTDTFGRIFTVFALIGMINAINHSDGLDGLAGGMSLLSLSCLAYLAYLMDGNLIILIALATVGGVFGFLRYNSHPARVFMGDGGSQFLGFTLGFLTVYLIEHVNTALSPALPVLILGLPIVDILAVFAQRIYHGMNWFRASKNHVHHRLLQLGFDHYESVVIIYTAQIVLVVSAILFPYESDLLIFSIFTAVCAAVFGFLIAAERAHWKAHSSSHTSKLTKIIQTIKKHTLFQTMPLNVVTVAIPLLLISVSILSKNIPRDISTTSAILASILLLVVIFRRSSDSIIIQIISYVAAAFVVYLEMEYIGSGNRLMETIEFIYFTVLTVAIGVAVRYGHKSDFKTSPTDYLVIFIVLIAAFLLHKLPEKAYLSSMGIKFVILFYGCELIFTHLKNKQYVINIPVLLSLTIIAVKGLY